MQSERSGRLEFQTRAVHAGRDPLYASMPIYMASTAQGHYTRGGNPTIDAMEKCLSDLEGGAGAVATACGMSAVTQVLLTLLRPGDRVVCHRSVYDWTDTFMLETLPDFGIETTQVDMRRHDALAEALDSRASVVYFEPLSNPGLDLVDVARVAAVAHDAGALVVVDNTFLTPALLRPLELGADVVIHSATKFLCGHSDALAGVVISNDESCLQALRRTRNIYGGVLSPFNAFLILRGVSTLPVRMRQLCANARRLADFLAGHPAIVEVRYPGLPEDAGYETSKAQLSDSGAMVGFTVAGGQPALDAFRQTLHLCRPWVSLGDVGTLLYCRQCEPRKGIPEGYVRMSVGLESPDDIISDLDQALKRAASID